MLLLGGAMIKFDDLHKSITRKIYVPVIGDLMATRWAYEALMVEEYKNNSYKKPFFKYEMDISRTAWYNSFLLPTLKVKVEECRVAGKNKEFEAYTRGNFEKLNYHLKELSAETGVIPGKWISDLNYENFTEPVSVQAKNFIDSLSVVIRLANKKAQERSDSLVNFIINRIGEPEFQKMREADYNESLADIVLNRLGTIRIYETDNRLIQKADPILMKPGSRYGRAQFYAPFKILGKMEIDTLLFNITAIWLMTIVLYVTLYFDLLKRFIFFLESLRLPIWRKFGRDLIQV
jgi:hypothetical protein